MKKLLVILTLISVKLNLAFADTTVVCTANDENIKLNFKSTNISSNPKLALLLLDTDTELELKQQSGPILVPFFKIKREKTRQQLTGVDWTSLSMKWNSSSDDTNQGQGGTGEGENDFFAEATISLKAKKNDQGAITATYEINYSVNSPMIDEINHGPLISKYKGSLNCSEK